MAAKMIRDGILDSARVHGVSVPARWLYLTILLQADDIGLFEVNHFKLGREAGLDQGGLQPLLDELAAQDLVRPYKVGQKAYGFVPRYRQRLRVKRARHPLPPADLMIDDDDAINKINGLNENPPTGGRTPRTNDRDARPEPEPEPEEEQEKETTPKGKSVVPAAAAPAPTKGRRLPVEWVLPKAWGEWALADRPGWTADTVRLEASKFADHWHAKSGKDAAKVDWLATWRNWCRNARVSPPVRGSPQPADTAARNAEARRLLGFQPGPEPLDA